MFVPALLPSFSECLIGSPVKSAASAKCVESHLFKKVPLSGEKALSFYTVVKTCLNVQLYGSLFPIITQG